MDKLIGCLKGGDLRSIAKADKVVSLIKTQDHFDKLFQFLFSSDRLVIMRAADAIEKITLSKPQFLTKHKSDIIYFLGTATDKEFKWHLALLASRLEYTEDEFRRVWNRLSEWAKSKNESRIVRVNSIQSLFDLAGDYRELEHELKEIFQKIKLENIPSMNARLKKLEKK